MSDIVKDAGGRTDEDTALGDVAQGGANSRTSTPNSYKRDWKKRSRGWRFSLDDVKRLALAFHVETPLLSDVCTDTAGVSLQLMSDMSETSLMSDCNNGHHGPVDPAHDVAPYGAYRRAMEARGQEPLSVPEWAQAGRPKGPAGDDGEWEEIAPDAPQEPGSVFRMDLATGKSYRRAGGRYERADQAPPCGRPWIGPPTWTGLLPAAPARAAVSAPPGAGRVLAASARQCRGGCALAGPGDAGAGRCCPPARWTMRAVELTRKDGMEWHLTLTV